MTETTTLPVAQIRAVTIEEDAAPITRLLGQRLREADRLGHVPALLTRARGTVAVRSHDTPQAATIAFDSGVMAVTGGAERQADASVVVDLHARCAHTQEPVGDVDLAHGVLAALRPPLPHWREAAERFWSASRGILGIPDVLLVETEGTNGPELGRFGDGVTEYLMTGPADLLAGVFTGADDLFDALAAGVRVKGTLSQLSVMTAASWKVRFDV